MKTFSLKKITQIVNGKLYGNNLYLKHINIDTRKINNNRGLFIALIGKNFDAHNFINDAIIQNSQALLVNKKFDLTIPHIVVNDTKLALGNIASWIRKKSNAHFIGITGSSGKTSVKEMTAAILKQCGKTLYSHGNFNNDIGVPITLLRLKSKHKYAVIELGANHIGEIEYTSKIVNPDSILINNITPSHLEGFGSLEEVAYAKGEILLGLKKKVQLLLIVIIMIGLTGKKIFTEKLYGLLQETCNIKIIFGLVIFI